MNEDWKPGILVPAEAGIRGEELRTAVGHLYATFAPYDRLSSFVGCECGACVTEEENAAIHARPLRALTAEDLKPVGSSTFVLTTDLKHLLPRIAELVAEGYWEFGYQPAEFFFITNEMVEGWNDWRTAWPGPERDAVEAYAFALWRAALGEYPERVNAGQVLHIIAQFFDDLGPFLAIWQSLATTTSMRQLLALIDKNVVEIGVYHRLGKTFWLDRVRVQEGQVLAWLLDPGTERAIVQAYREHAASEVCSQEMLDQVIARLRDMRSSFEDIEYFIQSNWESGTQDGLHSLKLFVENHFDALATTGRLHSRLLSRNDTDPWRGREVDEQKVITWLLRPETAQILRDYRAANPVPYPTKAPEQLDRLRAQRDGRDSRSGGSDRLAADS